MNKEEYKQWIKNVAIVPKTIDVSATIKEYPYCMLLHLFQTLQTDVGENRTLLTMLHPDRKHLADLFLQSKQTSPANDTKSLLLEKELEKEKETTVKKVVSETKSQAELVAILQNRLEELRKDTHTQDNGKEEEIYVYEPGASISLDELIEKFNQNPPQISFNPADMDEQQTYKDLGKSSLMERMNIVSETLAELYCSQKAYDKALKIYEALLLKYPEKNATFAKLISEIKEKKKS
jgi:hypothetical protein